MNFQFPQEHIPYSEPQFNNYPKYRTILDKRRNR